jgi:hypothetical protein
LPPFDQCQTAAAESKVPVALPTIHHPNQEIFMPHTSTSIIRVAALAALVGSFAVASPLNAAPADTPSAQTAAQHVEDRIQTLHDKLGVTSEQEEKWSDVAEAMRENETTIDQMVRARHQDPTHMNAVDDLQSYESITQAHADGLKKLIVAFQALYDDMPDSQKKNADMTFSRFEGHDASAASKKHS